MSSLVIQLRQNVHRGLRQVRVILFGVASDRSCRGGNLVRVTEFERIHAYLSLKCTTGTRGMGEHAVPQLNSAIQMAETAVHGGKLILDGFECLWHAKVA
jgi:hypothetical protein